MTIAEHEYETSASAGDDKVRHPITDEPLVVISADCHAGGDIADYKPYLEGKWYEEFDEWANAFSDPWDDLERELEVENAKVGVASAHEEVNWNSSLRQQALEADGVVAEVVFPNTVPPFFPSGVISVGPPKNREEYDRRWAGLRAHNRWLREFCEETPGRRAGVAQILLNNPEDAVREVQWIKEAGLTGGILLPADHTAGQTVALYYPRYDPIWETCAELDVPVHRHSSLSGDVSSDENGTAASAVTLFESPFFSHRGLAHMIFAGVFERYPKLKYVLTESGAGWAPAHLAQLDAMYESAKWSGTVINKFAGDAVSRLPKRPSEYFAENCWLGASQITKTEVALRDRIGVDRIMWGSDFPHAEGTYPFSREALGIAFEGVAEADLRGMLGKHAAQVYGFDYTELSELAKTIGPTIPDISAARERRPSYPKRTVCSVFADTGNVLFEQSDE